MIKAIYQRKCLDIIRQQLDCCEENRLTPRRIYLSEKYISELEKELKKDVWSPFHSSQHIEENNSGNVYLKKIFGLPVKSIPWDGIILVDFDD